MTRPTPGNSGPVHSITQAPGVSRESPPAVVSGGVHASQAESEASPTRELPPVRVPRTASGRRGGRAPGSRPMGAAYVWRSVSLAFLSSRLLLGTQLAACGGSGQPWDRSSTPLPRAVSRRDASSSAATAQSCQAKAVCLLSRLNTQAPARAACFLAMGIFILAATLAIVCGYLNPFALFCC